MQYQFVSHSVLLYLEEMPLSIIGDTPSPKRRYPLSKEEISSLQRGDIPSPKRRYPLSKEEISPLLRGDIPLS